jgi:hypothetical protein
MYTQLQNFHMLICFHVHVSASSARQTNLLFENVAAENCIAKNASHRSPEFEFQLQSESFRKRIISQGDFFQPFQKWIFSQLDRAASGPFHYWIILQLDNFTSG